MPNADLRDPADRTKFKPRAHFEVLAAMLHPKDKVARERVMDTIRRETGSTQTRRGVLSEERSRYEQKRGFSRGGASGYLMTKMIQLHTAQEIQPTLHAAIQLVQKMLPRIPGGGQREVQGHWDPGQLVRSEPKLRKIFSDYGSVAHHWAAALHVGLPYSVERIPEFINTANAILALYSSLPIKRHIRAVDAQAPWIFKIPETLVVKKNLRPCPLTNEMLEDITRRTAPGH